jgi:hypothetical protein
VTDLAGQLGSAALRDAAGRRVVRGSHTCSPEGHCSPGEGRQRVPKAIAGPQEPPFSDGTWLFLGYEDVLSKEV